ncbi:MAG: alanyl-tRNA synthetase [Leuconostoc citreum]
MDITINKQVRSVMPDLKDKELVDKMVDEKPVKSRLGILILMAVGFLVIIFGALMIYVMTQTNKTSQNDSGTSSPKVTKNVTSSKYVAGKDYKVTYSNQNVIDKGVLDKALEASNGKNINFMMDTSEDGGNMAKVEVYYNKDKNLLVERLFKNGYQGDQETTRVVYDINQGKIPDNGDTPSLHYQGLPLVYKWEKIVK